MELFLLILVLVVGTFFARVVSTERMYVKY